MKNKVILSIAEWNRIVDSLDGISDYLLNCDDPEMKQYKKDMDKTYNVIHKVNNKRRDDEMKKGVKNESK